jgi:hypothetical protein
MRLTAGTDYWLSSAEGHWHHVSVDNDGAARCATARLEVDADGNVTRVTSKPAPARADDGARVEAHPAGAKEGHGWSVSATRTIGNVRGLDSPAALREMRKKLLASYGMEDVDARTVFTAADLDAVRDVPVTPDETPLADMAKPDDVFAQKSREQAERYDRIESLAPPVLPRDPSPGVCPTCRVQRRERGEVRVHYWRCGCAVRPEHIYEAKIDGGEMGWVAVSHFDAEYEATGAQYKTVEHEHPTRDGAIAAWREALAGAQRREDAQ